MSGVLKGIGWALIALLLVFALALWWLDWNDLREPLSNIASRELGHGVVIEGDLDVDLGWTPRVHAQDVRIADAPWSEQPYMAQTDISFSVPLSSVLRGAPAFHDVVLEQPYLRLARNAEGEANWDFLVDETDDEPPPRITALQIHEGRLEYHDALLGARIEGRLFTADGGTHLEAEGSYREEPLKALVSTGALPAFIAGEAPFPIEAELWYAAQYVSAQGRIDDPDNPLDAFTFAVAAEGGELGVLLQAFDVPAPDMNAFALSGQLNHARGEWRVSELQGMLKETRIQAGALTADTAAEPPRVSGELHLARLDLKELFEFFGLDDPPEEERERLLPDDPIPVEWLNAFQADVTLRTDDAALWLIEGNEMVLGLRLAEGVLTLDPVRMNVAEGVIEGKFQLQARAGVPNFMVDIRMGSASLKQMFHATEMVEILSGLLSGRIELKGRGASLAEAVGDSEGQVGLVVTQGAIDRMVAEGIALNLIELLFGDGAPDQQLRCGVAAFNVSGGHMTSEVLVVDTDERVIMGEGSIDLQRELLDLEFTAHAKEAGSLAAQTPVTIEGSLLTPEFGIREDELIARGVAAVILGVIATPLAGVLPFIEPGVAEDHDCQALIREAQAALAAD